MQILVRGALARSEAVFSRRLEYEETGGVGPKQDPSRTVSFAFSGTSWCERAPGWRVLINHHNKFLEFMDNPQPDGSYHYGANVSAEKAGIQVPGCFPSRPVFAGSFWREATKGYVKSHLKSARHRGAADCDGVKTEVVEWQVTREDRNAAFEAFTDSTMEGGMLRLFIAPQLGCVLPRIEHEGKNRVVDSRFSASEFEEVASGLFFPKRCGFEAFDPDKSLGFWVRYRFHKIQRINQEIPENEFSVTLPTGTLVHDFRPGKPPVMFGVGSPDAPTFGDLEDVAIFPAKRSWSLRMWRVAVLVGALMGLALLVVYFKVILPRRRERHAP